MKTITLDRADEKLRGFQYPERSVSRSAAPDTGGWDAFETLPQAVHIMTEDGLIVAANKSFEAMFGAPRRRFIGRHQAILNTFSVAANLRLLEKIRSEISTSGSWRGTFRNQRADGDFVMARALIHPMRLADRRYLVCFQEDEYPVTATAGASCSWLSRGSSASPA
jgi:PAS domain S-box-containing protein